MQAAATSPDWEKIRAFYSKNLNVTINAIYATNDNPEFLVNWIKTCPNQIPLYKSLSSAVFIRQCYLMCGEQYSTFDANQL